MNISIIAHCSHNKGDNSVLAFLSRSLKEYSNQIHISTSSSQLPFWLDDNSFKATYWGCGERFSYLNEGKVNKVKRNIRNRLVDRRYYKILSLYSEGKVDDCLRLLDSTLDVDFKNEIKKSDIVVCTGGHHISSVLDKDAVNPQLIDMIYSCLLNKKLFLWAQSIGPVKTDKAYIHKSVIQLLNSSRFICYRDNKSKDFLLENNVVTDSLQVDDSVFGLNSLLSLSDFNKQNSKVIIALYTAGKKQKDNIHDYLQSFVPAINHLTKIGCRVELLPMQYKGLQDDERPSLNLLKGMCTDSERILILDKDKSPVDTLTYLGGTKLLIGHKTHSVVYGLAKSIPTVAISYHPKTTFFMNRFSSNDCVIEDITLTGELLLEKVEYILENEEHIRKRLNDHSKVIGEGVVESFENMMKQATK